MLSYNAKRKRGIHKIALLIGLLTANTLCACTNAKQVLGVNHYNTPLRFPQENKDLLAEKETAAKLEEGSGHFARLLQNGTITLEQVLKEIGKQKDSIERTKELLAIIKIVHPNLARLVANRTITLEQALKEIQKGSIQKTSWTAKRTLKWIAGTTAVLGGAALIYYIYYYTVAENISSVPKVENLPLSLNLTTHNNQIQYKTNNITLIKTKNPYLAPHLQSRHDYLKLNPPIYSQI